MPRSSQQPITTSELRARNASRTAPKRGSGAPSVVIVAAAMVSVPLVSWLISLLVNALG